MKKCDVLACSFSEWYPKLETITFPSKIIPLPNEFIEYLLADNLVLRNDGNFLKHSKETDHSSIDSEDEDDEDQWAKAESETPSLEAPHFEELDKEIASVIRQFGGKAFIKLNWSSPKDASWIALNNSLQCFMPIDVHLLLKSSDFILHDLTKPFQHCIDENIEPASKIQYELVLRKWTDINPGNEFRCFVKNRILIAISQRDECQFYSYIQQEKEQIISEINCFLKQNILHKFPLQDYVVDIVRNRKHEIVLVDLNPYGLTTDSLLFDWNEDLLVSGIINDNRDLPDFRFISEEAGIRSNPLRQYCVPQDIAHLTSGEDPFKLMDLLKLQSGKLDSSDSD